VNVEPVPPREQSAGHARERFENRFQIRFPISQLRISGGAQPINWLNASPSACTIR
jgi:hypothetical protein